MNNILSRLWQRLCDHWNGPQWRAKCQRAEMERRTAQWRLENAQFEARCWESTANARSRRSNRQQKGRK
jgi:hypothetical protein